MKQLNKDALRLLRVDLNKALEEVAAKHNIILEVGNASFTANNATFKLHVMTKAEGVETKADAEEAKMKKDFEQYHRMFGIDADALGKKIKSREKTFTVIGLDTKKRKYPIIARDEQGKQYKLSIEQYNSFKK